MERNDPLADTYVLPRVASEVERQDVLHDALRAAMGVVRPPPGPAAHVEDAPGTDDRLVAGKPGAPTRFVLVKGNVLHGLPFAHGAFDFVHQRSMTSGVPLAHWQQLVCDLVRVTRPGGWVELLEGAPGMEPEGPATQRLYDGIRELGARAGMDSVGHVFGSLEHMLAAAGAAPKRVETVDVPVGEWAGPVGAALASSHRALFTGLGPTFEATCGTPLADCGRLVEEMLTEFEELRPITRGRAVAGLRPG